MLYELSRLIMPTASFIDFEDLFINKEYKDCFINGALKTCNIYKFNTWMNVFASKKHYHYCNLGDIYIKLEAEGNYIVTVTGSNRNPAFGRIDDVLTSKECNGNVEIKIPNANKYEGIFCTIIEDKSAPIVLKKGAWCTDVEPQRENKLAIVSCTFKREDYVTKNIKLFEDFLEKNEGLRNKIKLFISDNGKTLPSSLNSENVTIYPNMNAGGAGGFTRGLMEVMKLNQGYTRVLFMDDDVEMFPESFYRTLMLSNYLKEDYKDSFINGAMLNLYKKDLFFENLAIQDKLWVNAYHSSQILNYNNILNINDIPDDVFSIEHKKVDSAWWFHCFDVQTVKNKGLPSPIFFRGDDVEWSWRSYGKHHISMNGICVWHSPFEYRVSKVADYYYLPRNMFYINVLNTKNFRNIYKKYFKDIFKYLIKTYDYNSLELLNKAMKDILHGSEIFRENPEEQFKNINMIAKSVEYRDADANDIEKAKFGFYKSKKFRKFLAKYCYCKFIKIPNFFFKKKNTVVEWYPSIDNFALVKQVDVVNLFTKKITTRIFDKKRANILKKEFFALLNKIDACYELLNNDYKKAHKEFSTFEFWEKYLEI